MKNLLKKTKEKKTNNFLMIIIALIIIWGVFTIITTGNYISPRNISNLFRQTAITGILAIGMSFIIISGEIDLSVGSQMALIGGIAAILNVWFKISLPIIIVLSLLLGIIFGGINGYWIAYKKVPSFIVTLAGLLIFRGILIGITKGMTIAPISNSFKIIGQSYIPKTISYFLGIVIIVTTIIITFFKRKSKLEHELEVESKKIVLLKLISFILMIIIFIFILNSYAGIPTPVFITIILIGIFSYILNETVLGRVVYAIGSNIEAVKYSGINVNKYKLYIFFINGILVAIGGLILTSRLGAGSVSAGTNAELDAIASCVIGGASLSGGIGNISGAILGALVMASLDNGMSMLSIGPAWQYIVKGSILLLAVYLDISSKNKK
ncbi:MAG: D-xylose transport system permease protein [Fusobacteriaceae bacterium]|jgi:D-xylose transport system permease protein|nr:D-xylose transport system permease protein [Fusobacteriaceae bacterium]